MQQWRLIGILVVIAAVWLGQQWQDHSNQLERHQQQQEQQQEEQPESMLFCNELLRTWVARAEKARPSQLTANADAVRDLIHCSKVFSTTPSGRPNAAQAAWNVAAILHLLGEGRESLAAMHRAINLQPTCVECFADAASVARQLAEEMIEKSENEDPADLANSEGGAVSLLREAVRLGKAGVAVAFGVNDWAAAMKAGRMSKRKDVDVRGTMKAVRNVRSAASMLGDVDDVHGAFIVEANVPQPLTSLVDVYQTMSVYLSAHGRLLPGLDAALHVMKLKLFEAHVNQDKERYADADARRQLSDEITGNVSGRGLLQFMSGLELQVVALARSLLQGGLRVRRHNTARAILSYCLNTTDLPDAKVEQWASAKRFNRSVLVELVGSCFVRDRVLETLAEEGAAMGHANRFGWTALHQASALGSKPVLERLLAKAASESFSVTRTTAQGLTPLHVAAMAGHASFVEPLKAFGFHNLQQDVHDRTPLDLACMHVHALKPMYVAMHDLSDDKHTADGDPLTTQAAFLRSCSLDHITPPRRLQVLDDKPPKLSDGGWDVTMPPEAEALAVPSQTRTMSYVLEVDGVALTPEAFVELFFSVERPVIVRGGAARWDDVRSHLSRRELLARTDLRFDTSSIPYGEAFGMKPRRRGVLVREFVEQVIDQQQQQQQQHEPEYVFGSRGSEPLASDVLRVPEWLEPRHTNVTVRNFQFYLGGFSTGAPVHFHRAAFNVLAYGRKRWALYPPTASFYSVEHPRALFESPWDGVRQEFLQEAGDIVFLPDFWGHAVLNLARTNIGYAAELETQRTQFEN